MKINIEIDLDAVDYDKLKEFIKFLETMNKKSKSIVEQVDQKIAEFKPSPYETKDKIIDVKPINTNPKPETDEKVKAKELKDQEDEFKKIDELF